MIKILEYEVWDSLFSYGIILFYLLTYIESPTYGSKKKILKCIK